MRLPSFWCRLLVLAAAAVCHARAGAQAPQPGSNPAPDAGAAPETQAAPEAPAASAAPALTLDPSLSEPSAPSEAAPAEPAPPAAPPASPPATGVPPTAAEPTPEGSAIPSPGELGDRLIGDLPPEAQVKPTWTAPTPVLTLHGYLRVRGELMDTFWLGRPILTLAERTSGYGPDPFSRFRSIERSVAGLPCAGEDTIIEFGARYCDIGTLAYANVRFRFSPQLNISEDVRVKATFDVLDNYGLGKGSASYYGIGEGAGTAFAGTDLPTGQTIVARRAWAEVRNRDLGELRFGIMPQHWGLGMLYNSGDRLDDDYSTDLGRVMGITKIAGFYLSAAYDFIAEGPYEGGVFGPEMDASQLDDVDQYSFSVVRRVPDEDEATVLERGDLLLNGGVHFQLRNQDSRYVAGAGSNDESLVDLEASLYTPDLWGQLRYRGLRVELEVAGTFGEMRDQTTERDVMQFGFALETELRLLDDKLGLYLYGGLATGDSDVEGLSSDANFIDQLERNDDAITTFRFHPSYRVDNILWRNIMRQVTGAYYFKPGISYDFVKDDFGQLFGARFDVIWSRAAAFVQTPGNGYDLGVELNAQVYWRSDDGPELDDGYHAALQYGVLFPMNGLGLIGRNLDLHTAQSLRLLLGVAF
jgi:uncharacterized protein (TIGR04551 family)